MNGRYIIPFALTLTTIAAVTTISTPPPAVEAAREARAIPTRQVGQIAKNTIVRIDEIGSSGNFGSGVIIGRREQNTTNVYTVLTAAHVLRNRKSTYQVFTPRPLDTTGIQQRTTIAIDPKTDVQFIPKVDLAIVTFKSNRTFATATIGDSDYADEGSPVYVAGFPQEAIIITPKAFQFTGGMISSRLDSEPEARKAYNNGYDMVYTNTTRKGMSGGPVFDAAGRLVGIHGQGDRNPSMKGEESSAVDSSMMQPDVKIGFNLGIPSQTFFKFYPKARKSIGAKLDMSPINYQLMDNSGIIVAPSKKFTSKNRVRNPLPKIDVSTVNETIE